MTKSIGGKKQKKTALMIKNTRRVVIQRYYVTGFIIDALVILINYARNIHKRFSSWLPKNHRRLSLFFSVCKYLAFLSCLVVFYLPNYSFVSLLLYSLLFSVLIWAFIQAIESSNITSKVLHKEHGHTEGGESVCSVRNNYGPIDLIHCCGLRCEHGTAAREYG